MKFDSKADAVKWLDAHPAYQKPIYVDLGDGVFVGDGIDLPEENEGDWLEVTEAQLRRCTE